MPEISFPPYSKPFQPVTAVPAFEALLPTVDSATDLAEATGSGDLAGAAQQLRIEMANLRSEVQRAAEEIRQLHEAIRAS